MEKDNQIDRLRVDIEKMTKQAIEFTRTIQEQRTLLRRVADVMEGWGSHPLSRYEQDLIHEMREASK